MARKKVVKTEADVKKKIISPTLKKLSAWEFMPVSNGMGKAGIPDHIAAVPIRITPEMVGKRVAIFMSIEAKAPNKKHNASDKQKEQMKQIDEADGITGVVSCQDDMDRMSIRLINLTKGIWNASPGK